MPVAEGYVTRENESAGLIPDVTMISFSKTIICGCVRARKTVVNVDGRAKFLKRAFIFSPPSL